MLLLMQLPIGGPVTCAAIASPPLQRSKKLLRSEMGLTVCVRIVNFFTGPAARVRNHAV